MLHRKVIGENLRRFRKARGWSQERLSDKSLVDPDFVGRIERGQVNVSVDTLARIGKALGIEIVQFFQTAD
jgi:transcriptional regulator with XRE-family HTH domain